MKDGIGKRNDPLCALQYDYLLMLYFSNRFDHSSKEILSFKHALSGYIFLFKFYSHIYANFGSNKISLITSLIRKESRGYGEYRGVVSY